MNDGLQDDGITPESQRDSLEFGESQRDSGLKPRVGPLRAYPGIRNPSINPTGVVARLFAPPLNHATTRTGLAAHLFSPRVARSSQPWAGGHNPFGIASNIGSFSNRAFILLETMIGVFVFAIGVLALARCVDQCLNAEIAKASDQRARLALENRMAEIEAGAVNVSKPGSEKLKGMFQGITLKQSRTPLRTKNEQGKELVGLFVVNLEADWKDSGLEQSKALSFYVIDSK